MLRHVSGIAEVVEDVDEAVRFYSSLGLEVERPMDEKKGRLKRDIPVDEVRRRALAALT
jgi:hypothetical protein